VPNFPDDSLFEKITATLNPCQSFFRTSHAFDFKHFAAAGTLTQPQSDPALCKNCGGEKLPVEREGKAYLIRALLEHLRPEQHLRALTAKRRKRRAGT
jgi:hypothetical protein